MITHFLLSKWTNRFHQQKFHGIFYCSILVLLCNTVEAESRQLLSDDKLIHALQKGGFNLYFRHERTDWSQQDYINQSGDWLSCDGNRIRQLSSKGRSRAIETGKAIRALKIPIGQIISSPYCRTVDTAKLMNLGKVITSTDVMNLRVAEYFGGRISIVKKAQNLLSSFPTPNTNTVIVAHGNVARESTPAYPDEGEALVFKPEGSGGFVLIGRLTAEKWTRLNSLMSQDIEDTK